jgi:hypothetical protein
MKLQSGDCSILLLIGSSPFHELREIVHTLCNPEILPGLQGNYLILCLKLIETMWSNPQFAAVDLIQNDICIRVLLHRGLDHVVSISLRHSIKLLPWRLGSISRSHRAGTIPINL